MILQEGKWSGAAGNQRISIRSAVKAACPAQKQKRCKHRAMVAGLRAMGHNMGQGHDNQGKGPGQSKE